MKTKQLFLLTAAVLVMFPLFRALADPPVTFDLLATFDYPGAISTTTAAMNEHGDVAGYFISATGATDGYVRFHDGHFSSPIVEPNQAQNVTFATGINNLGTVSGSYQARLGIASFLLSGSTFTEIDTGLGEASAWSVNDAGNFCGNSIDLSEAFVSLGGTVTTFTIPGAFATYAWGMNNRDQVVGQYDMGTYTYGFRRDADGTLTYPIFAPGATRISLSGINDHGLMVGIVVGDAGSSGIFFRSLGQYALYDYPQAEATYFASINNRGLICGSYYIDTGYRSFIVRVRSAAGE